MARAALGLGVRELAAAAKVSVDTVARFERGDGLKERTIEALQRALEAGGVEFTNGDQPGVRLSRTVAARSANQGGGKAVHEGIPAKEKALGTRHTKKRHTRSTRSGIK
jgi:transcriptional regulator with XRE-family HTH domain